MLLSLKSIIQQPKNNDNEFHSVSNLLKERYRFPTCNPMRHFYALSVHFSQSLPFLNVPSIPPGKTLSSSFFSSLTLQLTSLSKGNQNVGWLDPSPLDLSFCLQILCPHWSHSSQFLVLCTSLNIQRGYDVRTSLPAIWHKKPALCSKCSQQPLSTWPSSYPQSPSGPPTVRKIQLIHVSAPHREYLDLQELKEKKPRAAFGGAVKGQVKSSWRG